MLGANRPTACSAASAEPPRLPRRSTTRSAAPAPLIATIARRRVIDRRRRVGRRIEQESLDEDFVPGAEDDALRLVEIRPQFADWHTVFVVHAVVQGKPAGDEKGNGLRYLPV